MNSNTKIRIVILLLVNTYSFGQVLIPKRDTIIYMNGYEIRYHTEAKAVFMTTYKDGKSNGPFKAYYKNGKIWREDNRINGKIEGKAIEYTPNGEIATIEEWKDSKVFNQIIFYQSTKKHYQTYHFVSKKGFPLIIAGKSVVLDKNTPDSLIENGPGCEYIWLNGKRQLFSGKEPEKISYKIIKTGAKPGYYRVQGNESTFIRPLTKEEIESKSPSRR